MRLVLGIAAACGAVSCDRQGDDARDAAARVELLAQQCANAMVSNTCRIMQAQGQSTVPPGATEIFVAGIGPIDADLYRSLRESGDGMCKRVKEICTASWDGPQCKTARSLYGLP